MVKAIDWDRGHGPVSGTLNAAYSALAVGAVGHEVGLPAPWALGAAAVGSVGALIAGASAEEPLSKGAITVRASAWLAGGGWVSYALAQDNMWTWPTIGPLLACACGFGSVAGAIGRKRRKKLEAELKAYEALSRVQIGREWVERFSRVCNVDGCEILGIEQWVDEQGKETGAGYDLDVKLPKGGHNWRSLQRSAEQLASDADLPEGCGIEVTSGISRARAIVKVQMVNAMTDEKRVPHDVTPLDFNEDFDIGFLRDGGLAQINIRQFSAMMAGAKRTGKTNQLLAIITRLLRMPNLMVWVIDFNGGGVALQWLRAWDALGRPGRAPIDWVAADVDEAALMGNAAVRVAKARKTQYQQYMADNDTDLLPLSADLPGVLIITDEGAEVFANPAHRKAADPMKEVLRIAGASGINQLNCFLRATADTTGDTIIKSQSTVRIGMKMSDEQEMSYLLGWRSGVTPQDMPEQGFGALSLDESQPSKVFRGWRVLPSDIMWFVDNTSQYRQNDGFDPISLAAAGKDYETRWERADFVFDGGKPAPVVSTTMTLEKDNEQGEGWSASVDPAQAQANLRKAIQDAGGPSGDEIDDFKRVIREAGNMEDLASWPPGGTGGPPSPESTPEPSEGEDDPTESQDDASDDMRDVVYGLVKAMSPDGVAPAEIVKALQRQYGEKAPVRQTVTRWLREDDRVEKISHGKYAVKPEEA